VILDELPQMKRYGQCDHKVDTLLAFPCVVNGTFRRQDSTYNYYYWAESFALFNRAVGHVGIGNMCVGPLIDVSRWETLSFEAMRSMKPSFQDDNSLVNFVLELKDLKRIPDLWSRKRHTLRNLANLDLNVNFGILPFMSDVRSLAAAMLGFRKKLEQLQRKQGKVITRHYKCPILTPAQFNNGYEQLLYTEGGGAYRIGRIVQWDEDPAYHASCRFRYKLPDMSLITNQLKAFLDALGVRRDLSIVWNAVRFSFIIDWFFDVGRWLGELSVDNLNIDLVLEDFCHSAKYSSRCRIYNYDYEIPYLVSEYRSRFYIRKRCIPYMYPPTPTVRWPSIGQFRLGGSLVTSSKTFRSWDRKPKKRKK